MTSTNGDGHVAPSYGANVMPIIVQVYNKDITYKIIFDEILQIYVLGPSREMKVRKHTRKNQKNIWKSKE